MLRHEMLCCKITGYVLGYMIVTRRCGCFPRSKMCCVHENWLCCNEKCLQHSLLQCNARHIRNTRNDDGCFHNRQLVTARDAAALVHARRIIITPCPHALVIGLERSYIRPTCALSPLTNFPKQDSHHPMHPYPSIPAICAPRPHAFESVATSHSRHLSPCAHTCTRTP